MIYPTDIPLVDIQTVCEYHFAGAEERMINLAKDAPICRTQFDAMLMQWTPMSWPVPLRCLVIGDETFTQVTTEVHRPYGGLGRVPVSFRFMLDENGGPDELITGSPTGYDKPPASWDGWKFGYSNAAICLMAISFMHVKGARIDVPDHPSRQARRAWERSKQQIKVLKLEPLDRVVREWRQSGEQGRRVHLVRGHFKDFRNGPGVGGNPNARGVYWTPPHVKGNPERGIVAKQYETGQVAS